MSTQLPTGAILRWVAGGSALALLAFVVGCRSLEELAPPVEVTVLQATDQQALDIEAMQRGRQIYITNCAKCHVVEAVGDYTMDQWRQLLPEMAKESKLDEQRAADVRVYVLTTRQVLQLTSP